MGNVLQLPVSVKLKDLCFKCHNFVRKRWKLVSKHTKRNFNILFLPFPLSYPLHTKIGKIRFITITKKLPYSNLGKKIIIKIKIIALPSASFSKS